MMATAMARLLHGAVRALLRTAVAVFRSVLSTITASNRVRVSFRIAPSGSVQCWIPISSSLSTRRSTRTIFSSEHNTRAFRLMTEVAPYVSRANPSNPRLGVAGETLLVFVLGIQQVGHIAELFGRGLERLDLLAKLGLFGLF